MSFIVAARIGSKIVFSGLEAYEITVSDKSPELVILSYVGSSD